MKRSVREDRDHEPCLTRVLMHWRPSWAVAAAHARETPCCSEARLSSNRHKCLTTSVTVAWSADRGKEPIYWKHGSSMEPRDVPPHGEGLDASEELRPNQEPGPRGKPRDGEMFREAIGTHVLHEGIPLSRSCVRKGRHEQHNVCKIAVF